MCCYYTWCCMLFHGQKDISNYVWKFNTPAVKYHNFTCAGFDRLTLPKLNLKLNRTLN